VEACLASTTHTFEAAGIEFAVWSSELTRDGTLRDIHGDLAPVAVIRGENSPIPDEVVACPRQSATRSLSRSSGSARSPVPERTPG
jgi:hypothetical protein